MRNEAGREPVVVASLTELDAVVGRYITGESPRIHWEDSQSHLQFESVEEAIEALNDPFFQGLIPARGNIPTVLREVKEFRQYSGDLGAAWVVVEKLTAGHQTNPLMIRQENHRWVAAFGFGPAVTARTAPLAICLAALQLKRVAVELDPDCMEGESSEDPVATGQVRSFYG